MQHFTEKIAFGVVASASQNLMQHTQQYFTEKVVFSTVIKIIIFQRLYFKVLILDYKII